MPVEHGSVTLRAAATATAASAALPPALSTLRPASAARGWLHATQPCWHSTGERREENVNIERPLYSTSSKQVWV